jgi:hypothetical protein
LDQYNPSVSYNMIGTAPAILGGLEAVLRLKRDPFRVKERS